MAKLTIDEKEYELRWDFNVMADAEPAAGVNLLQAVGSMITGMSTQQLRGLLFALLAPAQPKITLAEAGALIRLDTIGLITDAIDAACESSIPGQTAA